MALRLAIAFLLALALLPARAAEPPANLEYRVKAAFLLNFTRFVEWPANALAGSGTLTICVLGSDPFGSILDETVRGKSVNSRALAVRRIDQLAGNADCRVLFVSSMEPERLRQAIVAAREQAVLTVSDAPEFADAGGMIQFLIVNDRVRFIVNRRSTDQAHLTLSSKLLSVAQTVVGTGG
jgi:hypothetical protein